MGYYELKIHPNKQQIQTTQLLHIKIYLCVLKVIKLTFRFPKKNLLFTQHGC